MPPGIPVLRLKYGSIPKSVKLAKFLVDVYFQGPELWTFSKLFMYKEFHDYAVTLYNCIVSVLYLTMDTFTSV